MDQVQNNMLLHPPSDTGIRFDIDVQQTSITKRNTSTAPNIAPLLSLFHPSQSKPELVEYSADALLQYTKEGNYELVKEVIDHFKFLNHSVSDSNFVRHQGNTSNSNTVTSASSSKAYESMAMQKVKSRIEIDICDGSKQTSLIIACRINSYDIASILIENGANVNSKDMDLWTPLLNAAKNGNLKLVSLLLEKKAHVDDKDCGGFTSLMWACYKNHLEVVKLLLKHKSNPNAQCKNQICCLSWAAGRGHYNIVLELLKCPNIKIDLQDQNSSTPILWAARKGNIEIVKILISKGANPDLPGMNNMNPLIISCKNGHVSTALYLANLENINVNHIDKDGQSALSIAAKLGFKSIVLSLLDKGAYVNTLNKKGDSILITAVKGGHLEIIEALLARYVEIDAIGSQGKTALHQAVDRGSLEILKMILDYKPDLEIVANDGDTPLLAAVKKKNTPTVNELLNAGSKVSPVDKNGDNVLHISLRNKSREITELILSNPKNSKYLYKPNKIGDTPHKIDASNPKSILTQIFGARQLNMSEDSILGYDLYSSALAEILSEPSLHTPITVGLYAKWGSGKSFLLAQLKSEMKSFAKLTHLVNLKVNLFMIITIIFSCLCMTGPFMFWNWAYGLVLYGSLLFISFFFIFVSKYFYERKEREWAERICEKISTHLTRFKLLLRILFLNPVKFKNENIEHKNLRFIFTEYGKISTIGGENALALMISSLNTKIEKQLGVIVTRLCRVFYNKSHSNSKYRRFCCIPTFLLLFIIIVLIVGLAIFFRVKGFQLNNFKTQDQGFIITVGFLIFISIIGSTFTWSKILWSLIRSPSERIMNTVNSKDKLKYSDSNKIESYIFKLKREVDLIAHTVRTIDAFTHSCTRLVIVIDGLDSCEQAKVLQILEIVHVLFTKEGDPFVSILAVDPHVLIKGIEGNLIAAFRNGNVNGHDYLRTIIHMPIYLQVDLSKAKALSKMPNKILKRNSTLIGSSTDIISKIGNEVGQGKRNKKSRKRSSKPMSAIDLTDQLIKSDYFSDVNPRNLRRLINIIALTGRLLRAYHIDFNWRILASWIYINEQWPYRCSWIVMHYEEHEEIFTEETTLNEVYEQVKNHIPTSNEPLLELDRNARKFEHFIQNCEPKLTCTILKKILPCTVNLDPYLIKLIKESIDAKEDKINNFPFNSNILNLNNMENFNMIQNPNLTFGYGQQFQSSRVPMPSPNFHQTPLSINTVQSDLNFNEITQRKPKDPETSNLISLTSPVNSPAYLQLDMTKHLCDMNVADVCESLLNNIEFLSEDFKEIYINTFKEKNINGKVLLKCDLESLKSELNMSFGDWFLFKDWIINKRLQNQKLIQNKESLATSKNKTPSQVTLGGSHRKVEFTVTPVKEEKKLTEDTNLAETTKKPLNSILVKQSNLTNIETCDEENSELSSEENSEQKNNSKEEEQSVSVEKSIQIQSDDVSPMTKLGKKIFKSIDNLFHKTERSNSRTVSGSINEDNETSISILYSEEQNKISSESTDDETNMQDSKIKNKHKKGRRESIKMDNLKKNLIKVKKQIVSNNEQSALTKSDLKAKNSVSSIKSNAATNDTNRKRSESGLKNLDEDSTTKTYFIFEDEDECY